tara:strand:+ start:454 stop:678 length:225 start_codon:yes stop_codon:yes gene_type:complete
METILGFTSGLLTGAIITAVYFLRRYTGINNLLNDKMFVNSLLKEQIKSANAKKAKKFYRRKSYNKTATKASKQ